MLSLHSLGQLPSPRTMDGQTMVSPRLQQASPRMLSPRSPHSPHSPQVSPRQQLSPRRSPRSVWPDALAEG